MSIVAIISSPEKGGNTDTIVNTIVDEARAKGKETEVFYINPMSNRKGCQGCGGCKKKGSCVVKDDITPVLDAIRKADGVILSSPVYFGEACGQYRLVEDRFFSFINGNFTPNIAPGKKVAVVTAAGSEGADVLADKIAATMKNYFKCDIVGKIAFVSRSDKNAAKNDAAVLAEAKALADKF